MLTVEKKQKQLTFTNLKFRPWSKAFRYCRASCLSYHVGITSANSLFTQLPGRLGCLPPACVTGLRVPGQWLGRNLRLCEYRISAKNNAKIARFCCGSRQAAQFKVRDRDTDGDGDRRWQGQRQTEKETGKQFITKAALSNALTRDVLDVCLGLLQYRLMFTSWLLHYVVSHGLQRILLFSFLLLFFSFLFSFNVLCRTKVDLIVVVVVVVVKGLRKSQQEITIIQKE